LRKIAGRRVQGTIQAPVVFFENVAVGGGGLRTHVDDVKPSTGRELEVELEG
jgi:hypothetical protein